MIETKLIPLDRIDFNPFQPRTIFDEEELANLATSLDANGQEVPIGVYQYKDRYIVHDGDRRVRSARKLGWKEIRAEIHDILITLDSINPKVLEMMEKADQANNQRNDITTMERARYRFKLFEYGVKAGKYINSIGGRGYGQPSVAAFAKYLGQSEKVVQREIRTAKEEICLKKDLVIGAAVSNLTEKINDYHGTVCLRDDPKTRVELIAISNTEDDAGHPLLNERELQYAAKAIQAAGSELKEVIIEKIKDKQDPKLLQVASEVTVGLEPEVRKTFIEFTTTGYLRKDELEVMAQLLKDTPQLAQYAFYLKENGQHLKT